MIINVRSKQQYKKLLEKLHRRGYKWNNGFSLLHKAYIREDWEKYKRKLCVKISREDKDLAYGGIEDYYDKRKKIEIYDDEKRIDKLLMVFELGEEE